MKALVERIVRAMERADRDAFARVAADALSSASATLDDLCVWLREEGPFPPQDLSSGFGEPPITLHAGDGWAIQLLAWVNGRTTIHEHDFVGAFKVLSGSSIQRRYRFHGRRTDPLELGALELVDIALLERGAVEIIDRELIHSVFHLDRPTLSLVVRTSALDDGRQYDYWAPHVALDPHHVDPRAVRQVQTLAMMVRSGVPWEPFATELLARADPHQTFRIVDLLVGMHAGAVPPIVAMHREMLASIAHARWEHALTEKRDALRDPDHRFFLAVLLSAPDRARVLELVSRRYPDAQAAVRRWTAELVEERFSAVCARVVDALFEGGDPARAIAEFSGRVGDPSAFVEQLRAGVLAALFR